MLTIRPATAADFATIQDIAHKTWPHTFGSILSEEQIAYMLSWMYSIPSITEQVEQKNHNFLLAQEENSLIGFCSYELNYQEQPKTKIHKIYLLPEAQGKGAGKALMEAVIKITKQHNNQSLILNVNRDNPAIKFYQHIGFKIVKEEKIPIGNGYFMDDYVMEKAF